MSTIAVENFSDNTLSVPTTVITEGAGKAWAYIIGAATPTLGESYNVASITDNGVGRYQSNFTNNMSLAEFGVLGMGQGNGYATLDNSVARASSLMATELQQGASNPVEATVTQEAKGPLAS